MRFALLLLLLMCMAMVEGRNNPPHSSSKPHKSPPPSSQSNAKAHKSLPPPSPPPHSSSKSNGKHHESPPRPPLPSHSSSKSNGKAHKSSPPLKSKGKDHKIPPPPPPHSSSKSKGKGHKNTLPPPPPPPPPSKSKGKDHKSPPPSKSKGKEHKSPPPPPPSKNKDKDHKTPPPPKSKGKDHKSPPPPPPPPKSKDKGGYDYPTSNIFDVMSFGAQGDGQTDDTEIDGKIIPSDVGSWSSIDVPQWIGFSNVRNMVLQGQGLLDGKGQSWWSLPCKAKSTSGGRRKETCDSPTAIRFYGSYNVIVRDLAITNSPQMHLKFNDCINVQVDNISISSPSNSPNTDGIHLGNTQSVQIQNSFIQPGDDCISIQTGSSNIEIHDIYCDHGHGISIGGLGKDGTQACVSNISVHDVFMKDSSNGVRIKTWQGGSGSAKRINFNNISVQNVSNPIVIDQFYCDAPSCHNQSSAVHVSEVNYNNIKGTYRHGHPIQLACSDSIPCTKITLSNIQLVPTMDATLDDPLCWNAYGSTETSTTPAITCIKNGPPLSHNGNPLSNANSC